MKKGDAHFYKKDLDQHVDNVLSLVFRGLLTDYDPNPQRLNVSQIVE